MIAGLLLIIPLAVFDAVIIAACVWLERRK